MATRAGGARDGRRRGQLPERLDTLGVIGIGVGIDYALFLTTRHRSKVNRRRRTGGGRRRDGSTSGRAPPLFFC